MNNLKTFYGKTREADAIKFSAEIQNDYHMTWIWAGLNDGVPYCRVDALTVENARELGWIRGEEGK